jgi:hypothetical protein
MYGTYGPFGHGGAMAPFENLSAVESRFSMYRLTTLQVAN